MDGWKLIVVGDLKTPHDSYLAMPGVDYLSPIRQANEVDAKLSDLIGWNCIQRRNMGFVYALRQGAELIATVDDDNIPLANWGRVLPGEHAALVYPSSQPAFDPLSATIRNHLWHRGFPVQWVGGRRADRCEADTVACDIFANLWNGAPDIDAVCRIGNPGETTFVSGSKKYASTKPMPFNSQNTTLTRDAMKDYFCFPGVGRMDDIYGAYVCQARGHRVVFGEPTVFQKRNEHDIIADMKAEMHGYEHCAELVTALATDREAWRGILPSVSADAWDRYRELVA